MKESTAAQKSGPSIAGSSAWDTGGQLVSIVFSLGAGIVLARMLGSEARGQYIFATSFATQLLFSFVNLGLEQACSVLVARDRTLLKRLHSLLLLAAIAMTVLFAAIGWMTQPFLTEWLLPGFPKELILALVLALPAWVYQSGAYGLLVGLGAVRTRSIFDVVFQLLQNGLVVAILVLMAGRSNADVVQVLAWGFYGVMLLSAWSMALLLWRRDGGWEQPTTADAKAVYQFGFQVYVGNLGGNVGQRIDQYFVKQSGGAVADAAFGVYTLATGLAQRTRIFPQALSRSSYARLCSSPAEEAAQLTAACFRQMMLMGMMLLLIGAAASPLIPIVYTAEFTGAILPFIIVLAGRVFANASWMLANYFSGHLARPAIPMIANWAILPLQAAGAFFAMRFGGLLAVAAISSISNVLLFVVFVALFLRWQKFVGMSELFIPRSTDINPWKRIIRRLVGLKG